MNQQRDSFRVGINVFVVREGRLLLGERKGDDWPNRGSWGLPGGHLERGEKMKDTAARELEEETGLHAEEFEFIALANNNRDDVHYIQVGFLAKGVEQKEPELREPERCFAWKWFPLEELPSPIFIGHRGLIKIFLSKNYFIDG